MQFESLIARGPAVRRPLSLTGQFMPQAAAENSAAENSAAENSAAENSAAENSAAENSAAENSAAENSAAIRPRSRGRPPGRSRDRRQNRVSGDAGIVVTDL